MSRIIEVTLYKYKELSDAAKEKARDWFREDNLDNDWWDFTYDDADRIASLMGITIPRDKNNKLDIRFTGFWSQGDGACYTGKYVCVNDALAAVKEHAPTDEKLHAIAAEFDRLQSKHDRRIAATIELHRGNYCHSNMMTADAWFVDANGDDTGEADTAVPEPTFKELLQNFRDFADWIYKQLQTEYEYRQSDEVVAEDIRANGYEFTAEGKIA